MVQNFKITNLSILFLLLVGLSSITGNLAQAQGHHHHVLCHLKKFLGPYPAKGSAEEAEDFAFLLYLQEVRTPEQCAEAAKEVHVSLETFFGGENGPLSPAEVKRLKFFLYYHFLKAGIHSTVGKQIFKRPRPYVANPALVPCIEKAKSYAYPSGHAAVARVFARVLAKKFPERAALFLERGDAVGMNRMLGGVHHPTDIDAGQRLGDALTHRLFSSPEFLQKLDKL
ncbi:MAG: hypothetical protein A2X86_12600 [Bdellovibrionales bacterium GWA2_49_15]|nr:MAG: hypothetical protein A2X86_12600 [Bdellovibrionales bacterium GWA2_49_15]HAZ14692.1 hypothetical protein [Bdellovibrionales bacterium]